MGERRCWGIKLNDGVWPDAHSSASAPYPGGLGTSPSSNTSSLAMGGFPLSQCVLANSAASFRSNSRIDLLVMLQASIVSG